MPERNPFKTVIVTGIPGVGKTTVLKILSEEAKIRGIRAKIANFGDYMLEEGLRTGLVENRDQLRRLPYRNQLGLQKLAAKRIISEAELELGDSGVLFVDTHCLVKTPVGYLPGLPRHVVEELNPDLIVVVEADPKEIISRRERDSARQRKDFGRENEVVEMMSMARAAAIATATITASSVFVVTNPEGRPRETAVKILELISLL